MVDTTKTETTTETKTEKLLSEFSAIVSELPTILKLGAEGATFVTSLAADFNNLKSSPAATSADIDALVSDIKSRSAQIQAIG